MFGRTIDARAMLILGLSLLLAGVVLRVVSNQIFGWYFAYSEFGDGSVLTFSWVTSTLDAIVFPLGSAFLVGGFVVRALREPDADHS